MAENTVQMGKNSRKACTVCNLRGRFKLLLDSMNTRDFEFQNFDLRLSEILPNSIKVMAPMSNNTKKGKNGALFGNKVVSKVVVC